MKMRTACVASFALSVAATLSLTAAAAPVQKWTGPVRPMFRALRNYTLGKTYPAITTTSQLSQWNGSFKDTLGNKVRFTMAGPNPATSNATTTIPVVIVPLKLVYGSKNGNETFDPTKHIVQGTTSTVLKMILNSPLLKSNVKFVQGGVNLGKTQYIDAYQRGNFWNSVATNSAYHVLLGSPTVLPTQTIKVTRAQGFVTTNPFGATDVGLMDINAFDAQLQSYIATFSGIHPDVLPIFVTYNIYLTGGGCCIGGYHNANAPEPSGQTYAYATFVDEPGSFSQDVSALSHEIGEWMDDPFVDNTVECADNAGGFLENGDQIELETTPAFGGFPYTVNGYTYNLQSLTFMPYWGASPSTSVNSWFSFQGPVKDTLVDVHSVCAGPQSP